MTEEIDQIINTMNERIKAGDSAMAQVKMYPLSEEAETAPFLLFLMGESLQEIASKTDFPKEILAVTARQRNWVARKEAFSASGRSVPGEIQRQIVNSILATTFVAVQQELKMVLNGERDPAQCKFIPKNINNLQTLIQMVTAVNALPEPGKKTAISGTNVQVNIVENGPVTKADLLKALADAAEVPGTKKQKEE